MVSALIDYKTHVEALAGATSRGGPLRGFSSETRIVQEMDRRAAARRDQLINDTLQALCQPHLAKAEKLSRVGGLTSRKEIILLRSEKGKFVEAMRQQGFLKQEILQVVWQVDTSSPAYEAANKEYERIVAQMECSSVYG